MALLDRILSPEDAAARREAMAAAQRSADEARERAEADAERRRQRREADELATRIGAKLDRQKAERSARLEAEREERLAADTSSGWRKPHRGLWRAYVTPDPAERHRSLGGVTEAIFGLVGVVIGGGLNLAGLWWIERTRDRRTARMAARILIPDVIELRSAIRVSGGPAIKWDSLTVLPKTHWDEYAEVLARAMDPDDWVMVSNAFTEVEILSNEATLHSYPEELDATWMDSLEDTYRALAKTIEVLRRIAGLAGQPVVA
jgi:hypothetical protein